MKRASKRFSPKGWTVRLVPVVLVLLLVLLVATILVVILSMVGIFPG